MRQSLHDASPKSRLSLSEAAIRFANPIVGDRKLPIGSDHVIWDGNLAFGFIVGKGVLQCIHDEFGHNQAKTLSLAGGGAAARANHFQRDWPGVANHRVCEALTQL